MENNLLTRFFETRFDKDTTTDNKLIGRPIVFEQRTDLGWCEEIIEHTALDQTNFKDVLFFVNHNTQKIPLARSRNNNANSTMRLSVDENGLVVEVTLDTKNNSEARSLYSAVSRGDISGMSFMFSVERDTWESLDSDKPLRRIQAISSVMEVSAVNCPAYSQTSITARDKLALDSAKRELESTRHSLESELILEKLKLNILYGGNIF